MRGCTFTEALNYDSAANANIDGACVFVQLGCTVETAIKHLNALQHRETSEGGMQVALYGDGLLEKLTSNGAHLGTARWRSRAGKELVGLEAQAGRVRVT